MIIDNNWYLAFSLLPALFNFGIAFYIFFFLPKNKTTNLFGYLVVALSLWQVQDVLFRTIISPELADTLDRLFCVGWIAAGPMGFHFACQYASLKMVKHRYFVIFTYLPFLILQRFYLADYTVKLVYDNEWGWITTPDAGKVDGVLRLAASVMLLVTVVIILRYAYKMRKVKETKVQAFLIAFGILIPTFVGFVAQVIYPLFLHKNEVPVSSLFMTVFSVATIVAVTKYRLFDLADSVPVETVLQNLKNIVMVVGPSGKVLYMNQFGERLFGCREQGAPRMSIDRVFATTDHLHSFMRSVFDPAMDGQPIKHYRTELQTLRQERIHVQLHAESVVNNQQVLGVLLVGNDITEQVRMLEQLQISNERYDLVSRATNDMVWDWDLVTGKMDRNQAGWEKIFSDVLGAEASSETFWEACIHPEDAWQYRALRNQVEQGTIGESFELEWRVSRKDGGVLYLLNRGYVLRNKEGRPVRVIGAAQDITLRKEAELRLQEEQLLKRKEITDAVILAQENERRVIGAELHDNVNQLLTSATLYLGLARSEADNRDQFFQQSERMIGKAMKEVRKLSHSLIPPSWGGETLVEALQHLLDAPVKAGLFTAHLDLAGFEEDELPFKLKLNIYRIVQEQLSNITKHAGAKHVIVQLLREAASIQLLICDDGVGFNASERSKGVGLTNIETRAFLHNGTVSVETAPGKGCSLRLVFPAAQLPEALPSV